MEFDYVITRGNVIDGSGRAAFQADVGIVGDRITAVGDLSKARASEIIDANGYVVAPGFIDIHTHSDCSLLVNGRAESQVHQGVTLEVVGNCGFSAAPLSGVIEHDKKVFSWYHPSIELNWRSFDEYLNRLGDVELGLNVMSYVGHGTVHQKVMKGEQRTPTQGEIGEMVSCVERAMEEGAVGFTTGLEYMPGSVARPEEILPLIAVTEKYNGLYATHVRNRDVSYDVGFAEALAAARITGVSLQISHIQPKFGAPEGALEHTLEMIRWSRDSGADVYFDIFPYDWNHTSVFAALPAWAFEGGTEALLRRLADPDARERMKKNPKPVWQLIPAGKWNDIVLMRSENHKDLVGLTFEEVGRHFGKDPYDAMFDFLLREGEDMYSLMMTSHSFLESDVRLCLSQPECIVMSDTMALAPYGVLKDTIASVIGYGWTARLLANYVRENRVLSLQEAIHKLTGLPAQRLGLRERGNIVAGGMADIVIFDPETIENRATLKNLTQYPAGIEYVIVNGEMVIRNGERTSLNPGRVIRRGGE